jgi:hypothetical protein
MDDAKAESNRQRAARYREKHAVRLAEARKIAALCARTKIDVGHMQDLAVMLRGLFGSAAIRLLRKELGDARAVQRNEEMHQAMALRWRALWLADHPGKTATDFTRLPEAELDKWKTAHNKASRAAERKAWKRDHPGQQWVEDPCGMSEDEWVRYERWRANYQRAKGAPGHGGARP